MEDKPEFTVRDRRGKNSESAQEKTSAEEPKEQAATGTGAPDRGTGDAPLPDVDFATFVLSLATSAQISLGAIPHPETNRTDTNIPGAKQMIDVLGMLQEKTKGNLSKDEATILEQVLFNLRMHFVRASEEKKRAGGE